MDSTEHKGKMTGVSRRDFLKTGSASALLLGSGFWVNSCDTAAGEKSRGGAKNVIFMVSDGMSIGTLSTADMVLRKLEGRPSNWIKLYDENRVRRSMMDVAPLNDMVTDSAASAAAWGCGHRVPNQSVNMGPNGEKYTPILTVFREAGKSTGLVTTTRITHATPAGFAANVPHRRYEDEIAQQYFERKHDVYLGGGRDHFNKDKREDGVDLFTKFREDGYHVINNKSELESLTNDGRKVLATFADSHVPYSLDHQNNPEHMANVPTLSEMTSVALNRLSQNTNGFILQIEGGRVDHGAHSNDIAGLIFDQIAFDDTIKTVLDFIDDNPDTLLIITTDHGNASPSINVSMNGYDKTEEEFNRIYDFKYTTNWVLDRLNERSTVSQIRELVEEATKLQITARQAGIMRDSLRGEYTALYELMSRRDATLGQIIANYLSFNWSGTEHTGDYVHLAALGPGSEAIGGFTKNSDLFNVMLNAAGIEMTF
jgi:alkaline phosphatase